MRRIIIALLLLALPCTFLNGASSPNDHCSKEIQYIGIPSKADLEGKSDEEIHAICDEIMNRQGPAVDAADKLYTLFQLSEEGTWIYTDDFAGSYIDEFVLHIMLTDMSEETISRYRNTIGIDICDNVVCFEYAAYSINQLESVKNEIVAAAALDKIQLYGYGIDMQCNKVVFYLPEKNEEDLIKLAESNKYDDKIQIITSCESPRTTTSLYGGDKVLRSGGSPFTLGFCGTYNGNNAVITCGHAFTGTNQGLRLYGYSSDFGSTVYYCYAICGGMSNGDYAILNVTNSYTLTNYIWNYGDWNSI